MPLRWQAAPAAQTQTATSVAAASAAPQTQTSTPVPLRQHPEPAPLWCKLLRQHPQNSDAQLYVSHVVRAECFPCLCWETCNSLAIYCVFTVYRCHRAVQTGFSFFSSHKLLQGGLLLVTSETLRARISLCVPPGYRPQKSAPPRREAYGKRRGVSKGGDGSQRRA